MSSLTPPQLAAKQRVEAAGGVFVAPSEYRAMRKNQRARKVQRVNTYPGNVIFINVPKLGKSYKLNTTTGFVTRINKPYRK